MFLSESSSSEIDIDWIQLATAGVFKNIFINALINRDIGMIYDGSGVIYPNSNQ